MQKIFEMYLDEARNGEINELKKQIGLFVGFVMLV
jgi:hypothetical protein